jgi:ATP-dependent Clp protease protease subunit
MLQVIHRFYRKYTGLELERIEEETDRDNFMSPKQAQELGIIDGIILSSDLSAPAATAVAA